MKNQMSKTTKNSILNLVLSIIEIAIAFATGPMLWKPKSDYVWEDANIAIVFIGYIAVTEIAKFKVKSED